MKIKKLLMTAAPVVATAVLVTPILTSCGDLKSIELSNYDVEGGLKIYGISGNFNRDTKYEFVANMSKWDAEDTPTEEEWKDELTLAFTISMPDKSEIKFKNQDQIKVICDGKELIKDQQWKLLDDDNTYYFEIENKNESPIKKNSVVKLQNVQFENNQENLTIYFINLE